MARPRKPETEKAVSRFDIRLKHKDRVRIETRAKKADLSLTSYLVEMGLNGEIIVNDNSISFAELSLIHQLSSIGQWLNKSFTHRANISGDLPNELQSCLRQVKQVLDYTELFIEYHDKHVIFLKASDKKNDRQRAYPAALNVKTVFQLNGLRNNLKQLSRIASLRDIHPRELGACLDQVQGLLDRIF